MAWRIVLVLIAAALLACPASAQLTQWQQEETSSLGQQDVDAVSPEQPSDDLTGPDVSMEEVNPAEAQEAEPADEARDAGILEPEMITPDTSEEKEGKESEQDGAEQRAAAAAGYRESNGADWDMVRRLFIVTGATASSEYRMEQSGGQHLDGSYSFIAPYIGIGIRLHKIHLAIRYAPAISYFSPTHQFTTSSAVTGLESSGLSLHVPLSKRWRLFAFADGNCGEGQSQLSSYLVSSKELEPSGLQWINPAELASMLGPNACYVYSEGGVIWQRKREAVVLGVGETYSTDSGLQSSAVLSGRATLYHYLTPTSTYNTYIHASHDLLNSNTCEGMGTGAGLRHRFGRRVSWSGEAGPEIVNCGLGRWTAGGNFATSLQVRVSARTHLGFTAARVFDASYTYLPQWVGVYQAYGTFRRPTGRTTTFEFDSGYMHILSTSTYFVAPQFRWSLARNTALIFMYLRTGNLQTPVSSNDRFVIALHWHPGAENFQRFMAQVN